MKFLKHNLKKKPNNPAGSARKRIFAQAGLALSTIVLTVVLLFAATQAWYTNVIQSSGLVFQTEQWGFTGQVSVGPSAISAAPGKSGSIDLSIVNDSDDLLFTSVNVSKAQMSDMMEQRIYFYVDASSEKNEEIRDRIYLNTMENYTYLLLSQSTLELGQTSHNDVPIKWEWVYDVLGYYCLATVTEDETTTTVTATIEDYLRPVTYDLDQATFVSDEEDPTKPAQLETVDGVTTVEEFLAELSKTDGYAGNIDVQNPVGGYYPVEVDDNGRGVWVYLLNYSEILKAIQDDTDMARQASDPENPVTTVARLTIISENTKQTVASITESKELMAALTLGTANVVQLGSDMTLDTPLTVKEGLTVLDLGGNTITTSATGTQALFHVPQGSSLTLLNGSIEGVDGTRVFEVADGGLTLSEVKITGAERAITVTDQKSDSVIRLKDCEFTTESVAVFVRGNGTASSQRTLVVLEDCTINSDYIGIAGNGSQQYWGTDIQIIGGQIEGLYAGIYQPQQDCVLTISGGSVIRGITGIAVKGGEVYITDSTVSGIGTADQITEPQLTSSGFADTGAGVYVETNYNGEILVKISGTSQVTSVAADPIMVYGPAAENYTVVIQKGILTDDQVADLAEQMQVTENGDMLTITAVAAATEETEP